MFGNKFEFALQFVGEFFKQGRRGEPFVGKSPAFQQLTASAGNKDG